MSKRMTSYDKEKEAYLQELEKMCEEQKAAETIDLFSEMKSMLEVSAMIYAFSTLRRMAEKNEKLTRTDLVFLDKSSEDEAWSLKKTITAAEVKEFIEANDRALDKELKLDSKERKLNWEALKGLEHADADLVEFADRFQETELVYAVAINRDLKRVTVIFRGSVVGTKDWRTNFKIGLTKMRTPGMLRDRGFDKPILVHRGFKSYLLDENEPKEGEYPRKYGEILEHLERIYQQDQYKDYTLYVTGHSLGGALCTLLAFKLASSHKTENLIPKPVNCISFASPYVGGKVWNEAFQIMEKEGMIRHIRVSNSKDMVPVIPPSRKYTHTGLNLHLKKSKGKYEVGYPNTKGFWSQFSFGIVKRHRLIDYSSRQRNDKDELKCLHLGDLYETHVPMGDNPNEQRQIDAKKSDLTDSVPEQSNEEKSKGGADAPEQSTETDQSKSADTPGKQSSSDRNTEEFDA